MVRKTTRTRKNSRQSSLQESSKLLATSVNPCSLTSIAEIPQKICPCVQQLLDWVRSARDSIENPGDIVTSIWPDTRWQYGPKKIGSSPGWWFRVYKPTLTLDFDAQKLRLKAKAGVKKTRGTLQFGWRKANHTFKFDMPTQLNQYIQLRDFLDQAESALNILMQNLQQLGLCPSQAVPKKGQSRVRSRVSTVRSLI
jgi:ribosomal protein L32